MKTLASLLLTLFVVALAGAAYAQPMRVIQDDDWCDRHNWEYDSDSERYCEVREITLPADRSVITVDGRQNGGIAVKGWNRNEIRVRAKVMAHARSEATAERLAKGVEIETGRTIRADLPDQDTWRKREWVSVSFELMVPRRSNLALETMNGGISIENVAGDLDFEAMNGGVSLSDLAGDVRGHTTNGGLSVELTGNEWEGEGLHVETTNGGVKLHVPEDYSAELETSTVNGRVDVDFPITVRGRIDSRIATTLGRGGKTIHVTTTNGSVKVRRG